MQDVRRTARSEGENIWSWTPHAVVYTNVVLGYCLGTPSSTTRQMEAGSCPKT